MAQNKPRNGAYPGPLGIIIVSKESINRLIINYHNARKSWEGWCFINNIDLDPPRRQIRELTDTNDFLYYLRYLLNKDMHIELYKIIKGNKNTTDNIFKLLRKVNSVDANNHLEELNSFSKEIKSITDCRDKFYAHLDPNYEDYLENFEVSNYYKLFALVEKAIIILGYENELLQTLEKIPSRNEFTLPSS